MVARRRFKHFVVLLWILFVLMLLGCGTGGYLITKTQLEQITIGESTKEEVRTILGTPKIIHPAEESLALKETWVYHLAKYASDPHTGVPPIGVSSWPITRNRPRPTVIAIFFSSSDIVTLIQERPRQR